jgi:hypothetical protein
LEEINIDTNIIINSQSLHIIADNCHHLRRLYIDWSYEISNESIEYFGKKCGQRLELLSINNPIGYLSAKMISHLLSFTPNLVSLKVSSLDSRLLLNDNSDILLPKLRQFECNFIETIEMFEIINRYGHQLVSLNTKLKAYLTNRDNYNRVISSLKHYHRLQSLELQLRFGQFTTEEIYVINQRIGSQLADNCSHLRRLSIEFVYIDNDFKNLLIFKSFRHLRQLSQLRHLRICFNGLSDNDFENIGQYLPKLESLVIESYEVLTDKTLQYISELTRLKSLEIYCNTYATITDSGVKQLLDNCPDIKTLVIMCRYRSHVCISAKIIEPLKQKAKQMPKTRYYMAFRINKNEILKDSLKDMPSNLKIDFNV